MKQVKLNINFLIVKSRPILIYLIIMAIYFSLFIYFMNPTLCEGDETIYDLKVSLITETHKHRFHILNYEMFMDTYNLMVSRPSNQRDFNAELQFLRATRVTTDYIRDSYSTINHIVARIKELEPTFQSPIQAINYLRVAR